MKLYEILLIEIKGDRNGTNNAGYIHANTGEVLEVKGEMQPHSSVVALHPDKFNVPQHMREELPDVTDYGELTDWAMDNDGYGGPWQHVAYQSGWVRFYKHMGDHNLSGYPRDLVAALTLPGVVKTIATEARRDPHTRMIIDIIHPTDTNYSVETGDVFEPVYSIGDIIKIRKQVERYVK